MVIKKPPNMLTALKNVAVRAIPPGSEKMSSSYTSIEPTIITPDNAFVTLMSALCKLKSATIINVGITISYLDVTLHTQ